jgi:hypothetical protein
VNSISKGMHPRPCNIPKNLLPNHKWAFKHKHRTHALHSSDYFHHDLLLSHPGACRERPPLETAMPAEQFSALLETLVSSYRPMNCTWLTEFLRLRKTKLCRTQVDVILNPENPNLHGIAQGEAMHRKYKRLKLSGGPTYQLSG